MKSFCSFVLLLTSIGVFSQNHAQKPIRFIFESEHDSIGGIVINSKKVKLFNQNSHLIYEADLFNEAELDETFYYYNDAKQLLKERRIFSADGESGFVHCSYDANGNRIEEVEVDENETTVSRTKMTFDDQGNMLSKIREFKHEESGELKIESSFTYTYKEKVLINEKGFENGDEDNGVSYSYEQVGLVNTKSKFNSQEVLIEKWVETFNKEGLRTVYQHISVSGNDDKIKVNVDYSYDQYGNILAEKIGDSNTIKQEVSFEYKYDENGNWIEKRELKGVGEDKKQVAHIKRRIEYYIRDSYQHSPMEMDEEFNFLVSKADSTQKEKISVETHVRINDHNGNVTWIVRRNANTLYQVDEHVFEDGFLVRINHLNNGKKENAYTLFKYNKQGQMIEEMAYSFEDKLDEKVIYKYNGYHQLIRSDESFSNGSANLIVKVSEAFAYDKKGQLIKSSLLEYGESYLIEYDYNKNGDLIERSQIHVSDSEMSEIVKHIYTKGVLTSTLIFNGEEEETERIEYEYDEHGDIIKTSHYHGEELHEVLVYEYF